MNSSDELNRRVKDMLIASVLCIPRDPGLTRDEIMQIGSRLNYAQGELQDALRTIGVPNNADRFLPDESTTQSKLLHWFEEDDLRSIKAYDFVFEELDHARKHLGIRHAQIPTETLVARAIARGFPELPIRIAICSMILGSDLREKNGVLETTDRYSFNKDAKPSQRLAHNVAITRPKRPHWSKEFFKTLEVTREVVERRNESNSNRPKWSEPLDEFRSRIQSLGYGQYEIWWRQMETEFRLVSPQEAPTAYIVVAGALAEAALIFVCRTARDRGLNLVDDSKFEKGEKEWDFDALIKGAKRTNNPIFNKEIGTLAENLKLTRQRIHVGRFIDVGKTGSALDLKPEEARASRASLDAILRAILVWLDNTPSASASAPSQ